jgi:hypothetical protein
MMVRAMAEWTADQSPAAMFHVGDVVNTGSNGPWAIAESVFAAVQGIPASWAIGNHDIEGVFAPAVDYENAFGAHDVGVLLFDAEGASFVVVTIRYDWDIERPEMISSADSVFNAHSDRWGIVNSHALMYGGGDLTPQGQAIYDALKDNPNVFLMVTGHHFGEVARSHTFDGRTIHVIMANYQHREQGGNGWLRIYDLDPVAGTIHAQTYSPVLDEWETDANSDFVRPWASVVVTGI